MYVAQLPRLSPIQVPTCLRSVLSGTDEAQVQTVSVADAGYGDAEPGPDAEYDDTIARTALAFGDIRSGADAANGDAVTGSSRVLRMAVLTEVIVIQGVHFIVSGLLFGISLFAQFAVPPRLFISLFCCVLFVSCFWG